MTGWKREGWSGALDKRVSLRTKWRARTISRSRPFSSPTIFLFFFFSAGNTSWTVFFCRKIGWKGMPAHWYSLHLSYIKEPSLHVHPILPPRQRFQKNHEIAELPRIYFGHERGNIRSTRLALIQRLKRGQRKRLVASYSGVGLVYAVNVESGFMHDLRGNYILSLNKPGTTMYGLSFLFSYVSAKLRNALPDFIRKYEFTGFKRESRASFCTAAFLFNEYIFKNYVFSSYLYMLLMYFSGKCNVPKILAPLVIRKFEMK